LKFGVKIHQQQPIVDAIFKKPKSPRGD